MPNGNILSIKWSGRSVCSLVVIAGIICFLLSATTLHPNTNYSLNEAFWTYIFIGVFLVILGGVGALIITRIINRRGR